MVRQEQLELYMAYLEGHDIFKDRQYVKSDGMSRKSAEGQ